MALLFKEFTSEFRSSGVQEFRSSGVQEFRSSGVQEFRVASIEESKTKAPFFIQIRTNPVLGIAGS
jgi:hypothetical protein